MIFRGKELDTRVIWEVMSSLFLRCAEITTLLLGRSMLLLCRPCLLGGGFGRSQGRGSGRGGTVIGKSCTNAIVFLVFGSCSFWMSAFTL